MAAPLASGSGNGETEILEGIKEIELKEGRLYHWKDVTEEFIEASNDLELGELLHDSSFGLFEAMSAIEMMDPKMDAGMMCNQIKRKVLNFEQAVEAGVLKLNILSYSEIIGIIDASLACMVTWLEGHSLAQTVFTNLYLHSPYQIENRILKAFGICMLKTVDVIRDRINRAGVFEEEDFQPMTYGFKMASDVTDARAQGMMKEIEEELNRNIRSLKSKLQGEEKTEELEREHECCVATSTRMKFYKRFLSMLLLFGKEKCEGVPEAQKLIEQLLQLIPPMRSTIHLGIQPEDKDCTKNDYPTIMGFEPLINQRLLPPTFPRYTVIHSRDAAIDYLETLLKRLKVTAVILKCSTIQEVLVSILRQLFQEVFKEYSSQSPCVLSRSILQLTFLPPNRKIFGAHMVTDFIKDSIRAFAMPPALAPKSPIYNNPDVKQYVDALMTRAVRPICNLLQICGHNRARQRDKWAHILDDLVNLQDEADKVDGFLHQLQSKTDPTKSYGASFGTWVLYYTLQVMINYTLAGFELELYAAYEYHYIYWYLFELLYSWLYSTVQRAESFIFEHEAYIEHLTSGRGSKKSKKRKRSKTTQRELNIIQAQQNMFGGYYKAVVGLKLANKLKQPNFEYDSEEVRYSHRFCPFAGIATPPVVPYSQYKEMTSFSRYDPTPTPLDLFTTSCKFFHQAKIIFESILNPSEEIQKIIRIAKTNFVMMKLLSGGHKQDAQVLAEFDFSQHKLYPIIKL